MYIYISKKIIEKIIKKIITDFKTLLLNFSFAMIFMIYKMWLFLKNYLNNQKDNILNYFFNEKKKLKQLKIENLDILENLFGHEEEENCYKPVRANNL